MAPEITAVLALQGIDKRIGELRAEIAALPKHIAEIEKALDSHLRRLEADRAALTANQKDRKKLEADVQTHQQKASKLRDQMMGAKTNEQYRAFQHEIDFCQTEVRKCEDRILDLMGEAEPLELNVKAAEKSLAVEKAQVEAEKKLARERTAADQAELDKLTAERAAQAPLVKPATLSLYERNRKRWGAVAVAEVVEGLCTGCQMTMRPQFMQDLKYGDAILRCESCGRIVYYNPPVIVEDDLAERSSIPS